MILSKHDLTCRSRKGYDQSRSTNWETRIRQKK